MSEHLKTAIKRVIRDEQSYASRLQAQGDFGRAKLAVAALNEIQDGLREAAAGDGDYATRLENILWEKRSSYTEFWDDEDGVGTSTFSRIFDLISVAQDKSEA